MPVALTIAGSDPSGGAGLQADLKTFHQHAVYGTSVVTLLTVQNTQTVAAVQSLAAEFIMQQLDCVLADIPPNAAKTGALGSNEVIEAIAARAATFSFPLVVDPVMISKHGAPLLEASAVDTFKRSFLPHAFLVTPNLYEAAAFLDRDVRTVSDMEGAAKAIADLGAAHVLVKGGHLAQEPLDLLWSAGQLHRFANRRIDTPHTHGTGCVFSAAITARLARGEDVVTAVEGAKRFITAAIKSNPGLGKGLGPTNMFAPVD